MTELSPEARALLEAARGGMGPDAATVARMRARLDATVATGGSASTTAGLSATAKLGLAGLVVAAAIGAFALTRSSGTPPAQPAPTVVAPAVVAPPVAIAPTVEPTPAPVEDVDPALIELATPAPRAAHAAPPKPADLAREVALIDQAMAALARHDATAALVAVRTHQRETAGHGQLAEDAAAIELEALCTLHAPVTAKLAAFDARWPRSAQRTRLTAACKS